jgi:hypothetical protein
MAFYNSYNALVSSVTEAAEDNSQEFLDYIPKAIELAQMRLQDELDLDSINTPVEVTCTPSVRLVLKPQGYRFVNNIFVVTSGGNEEPLKKVSTDYLRDYAPNQNVTGQPQYYSTDYSVDYFMLAPTPASAYVLRADIRVDTSYISAGNQQNIFTNNCANALFFATMKEQASFMKNPEMLQEYEQKYLNSIQGINNRGRRDRRQDGGTASTTESGKNTLLGTK